MAIAAPLPERLERLAVQQLHDEECDAVVVGAVLEDARDARVRDRVAHVGLAEEARLD
jgi:hypothetical protein